MAESEARDRYLRRLDRRINDHLRKIVQRAETETESAPMTRQIPDPCPICRTRHYNACPALWGGDPERPDVDEPADAAGVGEGK